MCCRVESVTIYLLANLPVSDLIYQRQIAANKPADYKKQNSELSP